MLLSQCFRGCVFWKIDKGKPKPADHAAQSIGYFYRESSDRHYERCRSVATVQLVFICNIHQLGVDDDRDDRLSDEPEYPDAKNRYEKPGIEKSL